MEQQQPNAKQPSKLTEIVFGAIEGIITLALVYAAFRTVSRWAKGTKLDYKNLMDGSDVVVGAAGGAIGALYSRSERLEHQIDHLTHHNAHLQGHLDEAKSDKSFTQQVTESLQSATTIVR